MMIAPLSINSSHADCRTERSFFLKRRGRPPERYAGEFPRALFRKHGITYELAEQTKSELFRDFLSLLNSVRVTLPRNDRLVSQIVSLERRVSAVGKETITHPPNGHDDLANAVAGAASLSQYDDYDVTGRWIDGPTKPREEHQPRTQSRGFYGIPLITK
jgi:hypothetical protein